MNARLADGGDGRPGQAGDPVQEAAERLIVALDVPDTEAARQVVAALAGRVRRFKVGSELFSACGPSVIEMVRAQGGEVFLDLKFHDIPNTVAGAAAAVAGMGVFMFNVHAAGGREMMQRAAAAAAEASARRGHAPPIVLAVTVLTSLDDGTLASEVGIPRPVREQVVAWARLARESGLDGVVASAAEVRAVKEACGAGFVVVTPGVRPVWSAAGDQRRVTTPGEALRCGADYLVVGRPVIRAADPAAAAAAVIGEMAEVLATRRSNR